MTGLWLLGGLICAGVVVAIVVVAWAIGLYNSLQRLRIACDTAFSAIDIQLKRRHDLVPNLVETVKGYAAHERGTLEAVIAARAAAVAAGTPGERIGAEQQLTGALGRLMAVAEAYPELKANTNFMHLQETLSSTESGIAATRGGYNGAAQEYNTTIAVFPANLLVGMFGFTKRPFFEVGEEERATPKVKF